MRRCAAIYMYLRLNQRRPLHVAAHLPSSSRSTTTTTASVYQMSDLCPVYAPFFRAMGCTSAIAFTCEVSLLWAGHKNTLPASPFYSAERRPRL
ncbi:hypothetical protein B0H14DRAFT_2900962, partial [Mycena olivaceomarginata]